MLDRRRELQALRGHRSVGGATQPLMALLLLIRHHGNMPAAVQPLRLSRENRRRLDSGNDGLGARRLRLRYWGFRCQVADTE
eukprot:scaffold295554_cov31-Tisochrysis_lutea.AAC.4